MEEAPNPDPLTRTKEIWARRMAGLRMLAKGVGILALSILLSYLGDPIFAPLGYGLGFAFTAEGLYEFIMGQKSPVTNMFQALFKKLNI